MVAPGDMNLTCGCVLQATKKKKQGLFVIGVNGAQPAAETQAGQHHASLLCSVLAATYVHTSTPFFGFGLCRPQRALRQC